jgi:hypothetical protein
MNVEQTTQLIQLILNSALMVIASAILLGGIILRQGQLATRWPPVLLGRRYANGQGPSALDSCPIASDPDDFRTAADQRAKSLLKRQAAFTQRGALMMAYASGGFMASMLILVIRTLIEFNGLILFSLTLFSISTITLITGIIMLLLSLHLPSRRNKPEAKLEGEKRPTEQPTTTPQLVRSARRRSGTVLRMPDRV